MESQTLFAYSDALKSASFSCCALMNASLNKFASRHAVSSRSMKLLFPPPPFSVIVFFKKKKNRNELTFAVGEPDSKRLRLWLALAHIGRSVPNPTAIAANVW
jgi:hypothetical protein